MWRASSGDRYFEGDFARILANGLLALIVKNQIQQYADVDSGHKDALKAFYCLTYEQKTFVLHKVALSLFKDDSPLCPLNAVTEAAIAAIFQEVEGLLLDEIDKRKKKSFRRMIFHAYNKEFPDSEEPLRLNEQDDGEWIFAAESLAEQILWDADYEMDFVSDASPEVRKMQEEMFGFGDGYFTWIPDDPDEKTAKKLEEETMRLCGDIIGKRKM